jgi:hypothetical protein
VATVPRSEIPGDPGDAVLQNICDGAERLLRDCDSDVALDLLRGGLACCTVSNCVRLLGGADAQHEHDGELTHPPTEV